MFAWRMRVIEERASLRSGRCRLETETLGSSAFARLRTSSACTRKRSGAWFTAADWMRCVSAVSSAFIERRSTTTSRGNAWSQRVSKPRAPEILLVSSALLARVHDLRWLAFGGFCCAFVLGLYLLWKIIRTAGGL